MKYSSDTIDTLYVGGDEVDKVYHGSDVAWLPVSVGTQHIQEITWTLTSATGAANVTANISNTSGLDIISVNRTSYLGINSGPRLWNGSEAVSYGAGAGSSNSRFGTALACQTWWQNYWVEARVNGGSWIPLEDSNGNIYVSCQTTYNNIGQGSFSGWPGMGANGDVIDFRVYTSGNHP